MLDDQFGNIEIHSRRDFMAVESLGWKTNNAAVYWPLQHWPCSQYRDLLAQAEAGFRRAQQTDCSKAFFQRLDKDEPTISDIARKLSAELSTRPRLFTLLRASKVVGFRDTPASK